MGRRQMKNSRCFKPACGGKVAHVENDTASDSPRIKTSYPYLAFNQECRWNYGSKSLHSFWATLYIEPLLLVQGDDSMPIKPFSVKWRWSALRRCDCAVSMVTTLRKPTNITPPKQDKTLNEDIWWIFQWPPTKQVSVVIDLARLRRWRRRSTA